MLVGHDLIEYVQKHSTAKLKEMARGAGYTRTNKNGRVDVLIRSFNQALLAAKGLNIAPSRAPGKIAGYETTVHRSGIALVGKTYTEEFGLKPGDSLSIELGEDCIKLIPRPATQTEAKAKA